MSSFQFHCSIQKKLPVPVSPSPVFVTLKENLKNVKVLRKVVIF